MNLSDIIALAKAGYKFSEVKELMSMAEVESQRLSPFTSISSSSFPDAETKDKAVDDKTKTIETPKTEPKPSKPDEKNEPDETVTKDETDTTDYKKLYEEAQEKIKNIQKENRSADISKEIKTDEDVAINYVNNLFK